jgi:dihydrofolate reductase
MSKVSVAAFSIFTGWVWCRSSARPEQSPRGLRLRLHRWFQETEVFKKMQGQGGGNQGVDNDFVVQLSGNVGAWILGRNMFGPVRGPWKDDSWKGWWGDNPPYHTPVFVLMHHARPSPRMEGGPTLTNSRE